MEICTRYVGMDSLEGGYLIHTNCADIKVCFVTDETVRLRASFDKELAEESYILMTTAWADRLDSLFEGERTRVSPCQPAVCETEGELTFDTGKVKLVLQKSPLNFRLYNAEGELLYSALPGNPSTLARNSRITTASTASAKRPAF